MGRSREGLATTSVTPLLHPPTGFSPQHENENNPETPSFKMEQVFNNRSSIRGRGRQLSVRLGGVSSQVGLCYFVFVFGPLNTVECPRGEPGWSRWETPHPGSGDVMPGAAEPGQDRWRVKLGTS